MPTTRNIPTLSDSPSTETMNARKHLTRREFSQRLYRAMLDKDWTQAELARQADILRDSVTNYIKGRILPEPVNLKKLAKALGMKEADLLPNVDEQAIDAEVNPALEIKASATNPNRQWVRLNREVSPTTAIKIMQALEEDVVVAGGKK